MKTPYVYCIFRLDRKYYKRINKDLRSRGYSHARAIIPTVSVLKKSRNGKNEYEDVPLLFNYGFLRLKSDKAFNRYYLNTLKRAIPGIMSFMKSLDSRPKRKRLRIDNAEDLKNKAMDNKPALKRKYINIPIGDVEYGFKVSGIGAKAIRLEKYVKYDEIIEAVESAFHCRLSRGQTITKQTLGLIDPHIIEITRKCTSEMLSEYLAQIC